MSWLRTQASLLSLVVGDVRCLLGQHAWKSTYNSTTYAGAVYECRRPGCTRARDDQGNKLR